MINTLLPNDSIPEADILGRIDSIKKQMDLAGKMGYADPYLGIPGLKSRFVGHGIGVELVENPILAKGRQIELAPGMVFVVEPKFIFKDQFAAGVESVIRVTETGSRFVSRTPHKIFSI